MKKNKALIISIGTGTKPGHEAQESLAHGILYSINSQNPDMIYFVATKESVDKTLPLILPNINIESEIFPIEDPDDINKIYNALSIKLKEMKGEFPNITVDFTSGTKAMTGALTILASLHEVNSLSYVTGERQSGIVLKGTEKLLNISPYPVILDKKYSESVTFFNKYQFDAALEIINQVEGIIAGSGLLRFSKFKSVVQAYSVWDKFDHHQAFNIFLDIKLPELEKNRAFLGKLINNRDKEPLFIADLINNARRRGEEGKYDDAVARLYRVIELIGQYKLKDHGIGDTSDVPLEKIPLALKNLFQDRKGKIQIGLDMDYKLLNGFRDNLGSKFIKDNKLRDALKRRNESILAHGLQPVSGVDYEKLLSVAMDFAMATIKDLDKLLSESCFAMWSE